MDRRRTGFLEEYLAPVPTPPGVTSREIVRRAIEFDRPPRIPYSFNRPLRSDFFETGFSMFDPPKVERLLGAEYYDQWGVGWRVSGRHWDFSFDHPLQDLRKLDQYRFPDLAGAEQVRRLAPVIEMARRAGKYVVGADPISPYEKLRALMGYEALMIAPYDQPEGLDRVLDRLTDLVVQLIGRWAQLGADAFMTWEDFGLQRGLQMKLPTFQRFYKPQYARMVTAAHSHGLHYIWHNCGQILAMIPEMIEIGVDVVQIDQPRLMGHRQLAEAGRGCLCYWNTVDIQWSTSGGVTADDLRAEVAEMVQAFAGLPGGFMARHYPQPRDIGLSDEAALTIYQAFMDSGCSPTWAQA